MNPEITQQASPQLTPDEAAASLAFATKLSEDMMPKREQEAPPEPSQEPQNAPPEEKKPEPDKETPESKMALKNEIRTVVQEEMATLREDIQNALSNEEG